VAWRQAGGAVEDLPQHFHAERHFTVRPRRDIIRDIGQMKQILAAKSAQVVDARVAQRFRGEVDEPRPNMKRGHVPGAVNVPYTEVIASSGLLKSEAELKDLFGKAGVDLSRPIVNMCGSGVTAAILALAQSLAGHDDSGLYDASWCEWGLEGADNPVATG
jgi:thiosulfate/3-mercaptopyruvate sulfurtransferase